jgi:hypothetical protein
MCLGGKFGCHVDEVTKYLVHFIESVNLLEGQDSTTSDKRFSSRVYLIELCLASKKSINLLVRLGVCTNISPARETVGIYSGRPPLISVRPGMGSE